MPYTRYFFDITVKKTRDIRYWWLTMNKDVHEYFQMYDQCQRIGNLFTQNLTKFVILYLNNQLKNRDWILLDLLNLQADCHAISTFSWPLTM
jgi:hypothetical protein